MFKLFKPAPTRHLPRIQPLDTQGKTALDKPMEFAAVPLDRIVAPKPATSAPISRVEPKFERKVVHLTTQALALSQQLNKVASTTVLCSQFPWVMNKLALVWEDPKAFFAVIDGLMIDDRGNRQGFPFEALKELTELHEHYENFIQNRKGSGAGSAMLRKGY